MAPENLKSANRENQVLDSIETQRSELHTIIAEVNCERPFNNMNMTRANASQN